LPTDDWSAGSQADVPESASDRAEPSSPPSTGELPSGSLASRGELAATVTKGVTAAANMAGEFLTDDNGKEMGAFLLEEEEAEEIGNAAAGLLSRRVPPGIGNPDVTDLVTLGLVLAKYVVRQFNIRRTIKAYRAGALTVAPAD
ncbi:hypothetical protein JHN55_14455, partial [Streptomyces sp. MBT56]|uniref:hypothetical protein n=1 Tax=Streptomyces sp. MBT56 TaxID=1488387 RepID=UPI00190BBB92